jgi:hypothetical protein
VAFLKKAQTETGTWTGVGQGHQIGLAALPGLTLLECGVPATAPEIQKAAKFVRAQVPKLNQTYELALAILFLDRLGDRKDRGAIQSLALRLVAGQHPTGGWGYECRVLEPAEERTLLLALQKGRPASPLELFVSGPIKKHSDPGGGIVKPIKDANPQDGSKPPDGSKDPEPVAKPALPPGFRDLPALQPPSQSHAMPEQDPSFSTNNSTTQFAVLGLWAARRHNLPLERALALVVQRFRTSQARGGGWNYIYETNAGSFTPSMTGAGLLGLAVGHGLTADSLSSAAREELAHDPAIEKGLKVLSESIGQRLVQLTPKDPYMPNNLYLFWTVERVGVLYGMQTINGKEWYPWGAAEILAKQGTNGSWNCGGYAGATPITDTCFALLFLRRADLAKDLSKKLELFMIPKTLGDK